jgi:LPXTG-site transpeptidase (sortase) family protein
MAAHRSTALSRRFPRRLSSAALLITGAVLLLFALCSYAWMSLEQRRLESASLASIATSPEKPDQDTNAITLLNIPKIDLQAAVLEGTNRKALLLAPGHLEKTVWPGQSGNAVIAAHRDTFFRRLHELRKGDDIYVRRAGRRYHYAVSNTAIVSPSDIAVIRPSSDTRLTLLTCWPSYYIGPAPKRLVVVATLRNDSAMTSTSSTAVRQSR